MQVEVAGVYFSCEADRTAFIAINQLPFTPETLWVRLFVNGWMQKLWQNLPLPSGQFFVRNLLNGLLGRAACSMAECLSLELFLVIQIS
jgi:hypothetical protein